MESFAQLFAEIEGFQWDARNQVKNWEKHKVSTREAEEVFFNNPLIVSPDFKHSAIEKRLACWGRTDEGRRLSLSFAVRARKIRIITARDIRARKGGRMKKKALKKIPNFKSEDAEREFWDTHDMTDYFDMSKAIRNPVFPNLKPSTETISLRLPKGMLDRIKMMANQKDMPYQSLMKYMLSEKVAEATPPYSADK